MDHAKTHTKTVASLERAHNTWENDVKKKTPPPPPTNKKQQQKLSPPPPPPKKNGKQ